MKVTPKQKAKAKPKAAKAKPTVAAKKNAKGKEEPKASGAKKKLVPLDTSKVKFPGFMCH